VLYFSITGQNPRYFRETDIPEPVRTPLVKALRTDREKRWQSVTELRAALVLIKAPSSVEMPTVKATWRCKWCETVNPLALQHCGECGWDGRVQCAECGSEMRFGIQFCGGCGANTREYDVVCGLVDRLRRLRDERDWTTMIQQAETLPKFQPVGPGGQKLVARVQSLAEEARQAIARRARLARQIEKDLAATEYEHALDHIQEHDALSAEPAYRKIADEIPAKIVQRDLSHARHALRDRAYETATRIVNNILDRHDPHNKEATDILQEIARRKWRDRIRNGAIAAAIPLALYIFSAEPAYRIRGREPGPVYHAFYRPVAFLHKVPGLGSVLNGYARLWGASELYNPTQVTVTTPPAGGPSDPVAPPIAPGSQTATLRTEYESAVTQVTGQYTKQVQEWPGEYTEALRTLQSVYQREGDFDGWKAVEEEITRFTADKTLTDKAIMPKFEALIALQIRFQIALQGYADARSKQILSLGEQYITRLTLLQKEHTKQNQMAEAATINGEINRVRATPEFVEAESAVAAIEAEKTAAHNPT
jgi:hypothetical protein